MNMDLQHVYRITWLVGAYGESLRSLFHLAEDQTVRLVQNLGNGVIISLEGRTLALSDEAARSVKVMPA
jgi:hypothetical protein